MELPKLRDHSNMVKSIETSSELDKTTRLVNSSYSSKEKLLMKLSELLPESK